ncbi:unnamed protein product [Agarophyton chilense]
MSRLNTSGLETEPVDDDIPCFLVSSHQNGTGEHLEGCWDLPEEGALRNTDMATQILAIEETNVMPVTREEFLREKAQDAYCRTLADQIRFKGSLLDVDHIGYIMRRSTLDGSLQKVVPKALHTRVLYLAHYSQLSGHPGATRMYYTLKQQFYWPHMAHDVYTFVGQCESCVRTRGGIRKHRKYLKMFPAAGPLEFVAIDLLGPLRKTKNGYQHILVITDRFSKLTRAIPLKKTMSTTLAIAFLNNWVYPYGTPLYLLTDNSSNLASKFLEAVCNLFGIKHYFTTAYHPQTNGQVERFNHTLVSRLRHYTEEHQTGWDELVQPLTYSYNLQVHRSTQTTPFDLVLSRHPPGIVSRLTAAQKRYKADYDRRVTKVVSVSSGQYVYIDNPPSGKRPRPGDEADDEAIDRDINSKLLPKSWGSYKVLNASNHTVTVEQDGIPNTISIDRITVAPETVQHRIEAGPSARKPRAVAQRTRPSEDPTPIEVNDDLQRDNPDYNPLTGTEMQPQTVTAEAPDPAPTHEAPNSEHMNPQGGVPPKDQDQTSEEFPVDRLVGHTQTYNGLKHTVRWYGWGPEGDTLEPPATILPHFRIRYWRLRKEQMPADG